jgi:phage/plasmid-associated DNA primase
MTFRPGRPDDYCTYSCGLNYVEYEDEDPDVKTLDDFFKKVFVREDYRNFFLDNVCSIMEGGNPNKNFIIGTGETNGGKSVTYSLLKTMCGGDVATSYAYIFPREMFVARANSSGAARPDLSSVRGKRLAMVNELAKTETINIGVVKEMTGNDSFYARGLYQDPECIKPMFKLFMHCNDPPKIPGHDEATWERAAFLPFESRFVLPHKLHEQPVPKTPEAQIAAKKFVADMSLSAKINQLAQVFLWMMFKRFQIYKQTGLITPKSVLAATNEERNRNDIWQQFTDEKLITVEMDTPVREGKDIKTDTPVISIKDMHLEFTTWYRDAYPNNRDKIDKEAMDKELSRKIGKPIRKGSTRYWVGKKFAEEEVAA